MAVTSIEWSQCVWNPVVGCKYVSEGCRFCYAATMTRRLEAMGQANYKGLTTDKHFNGVVRCLPEKLPTPLSWKKPRRVFVNSMSDLFHENVPDEFIDKVFAVMAMCPQHTFQVLTKRAERMAAYFARPIGTGSMVWTQALHDEVVTRGRPGFLPSDRQWPLPNVWLGVSCEDQQRADERIPLFLQTPAAVRFLSCEPLLGAVDIGLTSPRHFEADCQNDGITWVIIGGESGPHARPCNIAWVRSLVRQCRAADVACFVKQLGSWCGETEYNWPKYGGLALVKNPLRDKKGGNPEEWPADLRVREFPTTASPATQPA